MYIDNNFFIREDPICTHHKFNVLGKSIPVYSGTFISLYTEDKNLSNHAIEITRSKNYFFDEVLDLIYDYSNHKVVYTKLDLSQTYKQVLKNKYFKSFIGKRQLIINEYDLENEEED